MAALIFVFLLPTFIATLEGARDGGWSEWSGWTECAATCGNAEQHRMRSCDNPRPGRGGKFCEGEALHKRLCADLRECPVDGGWSNWGSWEQCSRTCGRGFQLRSRTCTDPEPQVGGKPCVGSARQRKSCNLRLNCPRNGQWSWWSSWSACTVTCGEGRRERFRSCSNPPPSDGGRLCIGVGDEVENCNAPVECPINGQWSPWSEWDPCPVTCGTAVIRRFRSCDDPPPMFGGSDCEGNSTETDICDPGLHCPVNGQWSPWSAYGPCLAINCLTKAAYAYRQRSCNNPLPAHRGLMCQGDFLKAGRCRIPINCPVNGGWSDWSAWECLREPDEAKRTRACDNPPPTNGGIPCPGMDTASIEVYTRIDDVERYNEVCGKANDEEEEEEEYDYPEGDQVEDNDEDQD